jgi:hypothetical protein
MRRPPFAAVLVVLLVALVAHAPAALAGPADATATHLYIQANYALVRAARARLRTLEDGPLRVLAQVKRECPLAAAGSPQDPESTQMSDEIIGAMVISAVKPDLQPIRAFLAAVKGLHWGNHSLQRTLGSYIANVRTLAGLAPPPICADLKAWVANGFTALPTSTVRFDRVFFPAWVALGLLPPALVSQASAADRSIVGRSSQIESQLTDGEARAVENYRLIMNELEVLP